jgi:hypothetical protein
LAPTVYVVHCVDTEGPLYESVEATFERIRHIFHLDLEPSRNLLAKLQVGETDLGGLEDAVKKVVDPKLLAYNDTWDKVDRMLREALSPNFRNLSLDSLGEGYIYNWFCVDHVDYEVNPRRRDIGYHNIFDHYRQMLAETGAALDGLHFHYHPHPFVKHAHLCATHWWASSDTLYQVLSRRVIDRHWFPGVNRPGFQVNRPDSHWFLEQYIPFDLASLAVAPDPEDAQQFDFSNGRSGDWRRAPRTWTPYHPSHDDYQTEGHCRRWIGRCLNSGTRTHLLTEEDVIQAFGEARECKPVVMSYADHDFRDICADVTLVRALLERVKMDFPEVEFRYCEAVSAMRQALSLPRIPRCELELTLQSVDDHAHVLTVRTEAPTFGPQPYLAIKTVAGMYHHDNFDFQISHHEWTYTFDGETLPLRAVETIGVATNNAYGVTSVAALDTLTGQVTTRYWNESN